MINLQGFTLNNGLKVAMSKDDHSALVAVNILYDVGSKHDPLGKSGLAHLFEHMMFTGTNEIPDIDKSIQLAGGENNAFTNQDITNYYGYLPIDNLDLMLFIEADRMQNLILDKPKFDIQKKVVLEEYQETVLNEPYSDFWHHLGPMAFPTNGYCWPTIGFSQDDINAIEHADIKNFYAHVNPQNAYLSICGPIDYEQVRERVHHYFDPIVKAIDTRIPRINRSFNRPPQREKIVEKSIPEECVFLAFPMVSRIHPDYYIFDVLSDLLSQGKSSYLYRSLIADNPLLSYVDAWVNGNEDEGLLIIEMRLNEGEDWTQAIEQFAKCLHTLANDKNRLNNQLRKVKNLIETNLAMTESSIVTKSMSLSFYNHINKLDEINEELGLYERIQVEDVLRILNDHLLAVEPFKLVYTFNKQTAHQ